jgi:lipopolysaccharide export system protein LptC
MQNFIKSYSRAIKWAKLIMPVIAVLLLASVFIFGKEDALRSGTLSIDADTINLTTDQKITNPQFSGLTNLGDSFILKAIEAMPDSPSPEKIDLIGPSLAFDALQGVGFKISSKNGSVNFIKQSAELNGNVYIDMTNGYKAISEKIQLNLKLGNLIAPNSVEASGPYGKIIAGSMELFKDFDNKTSQVSGNLNFSDGVTLIYLPSTVK